jgi:hypothetical protein
MAGNLYGVLTGVAVGSAEDADNSLVDELRSIHDVCVTDSVGWGSLNGTATY